MGSGFHGGFGETAGFLGTTYSGEASSESTYADRGIDIPESIQSALSQLSDAGDYIESTDGAYSMRDVSIMSKETGVEFANVTIEGESYLIRGTKTGTNIPGALLKKMKIGHGTLDFHSHPHNDDCIPSNSDRAMMKMLKRMTGQQYSTIVTPNGKTALFNENGVVEIGHVSNKLDDSHKKALLELFGG